MLVPTKDKVFKADNFRAFTTELLEILKTKIKWVTTCPACSSIVGLNVCGLLIDEKTNTPLSTVLSCRECEAAFTTQIFV
jgi:hypothetical protein